MTVLTIPNRPRQASPTSRQQCPLPRQRPPTPRSHQRQQTDPAARASILDLARVLRGPSRRRRTTARCPTCPRTQTKRRGCQLHVHTVRNHHTGAPQKAGETEDAAGSRPVVEVWKRERSREREAGKGDGHARVRARTRALALAARLRLRVRGRDALLLGWGDVRIDLYIPDGFQSVYAALNVSQELSEETEGCTY